MRYKKVMIKTMITSPRPDIIQIMKNEHECHLKAEQRGNNSLHIPLRSTYQTYSL